MFYYIPFLFLVFLGLAASTAAFVWAYRSGQFSDQGRAGYLPLSDLGDRNEDRGRDTKGPYVLLALLASASAILVFTLILALLNRNGG